jgi:hypothetical protein
VKTTTLAIILIIYGLGLYFWDKKTVWRLNDKISKRIIQFHYVLTFLVVISIVLTWIGNWSFSGQWTTRVIVMGFLLSGILIHPLTNWAGNRKIEKYYFRLLSFLPTLTALFSLIPFAGMLMISTLFGQLLYPVNKVYFESNKLRVQSSYLGPMWPPGIYVYQKKGLLEKQLVTTPISELFIDSVGVEQQPDSTFVTLFDNENGKQVTLKFKIE